METKKSNRRIAVHMSICATAIGFAGVFIYFGMMPAFYGVATAVVLVMLLNLMLRGLGSLINQKFSINDWIKRTCSILLSILNILVPISCVVYTVQDSMIFHQVMDSESRDYLRNIPGFHEVQFTADNGKVYHGMIYQVSDEPAPLVIYFGGNAEVSYRNLRNRDEQGHWQYFSDYHYLFVDYEGYGLNDGQPHYLKMYEHALAVYDYAITLPYVDSNRIVAMGFSLGTGSGVYLAAHRPVAGVILAAPYANGYDLYNNMLSIFYGPMRLLVKQKLPSEMYAPNVTCPVLIFASQADEAIPFSSSKRLSELLGGDVELMELDDALHNDIFNTDGVFHRVQSFLEEVALK